MSSLTITIFQSALHWENREANLQMWEEKIMQLKPEILAERMDGNTINWMRRVAAQKRIILTGSVIIEEDGHYFNRLVWMLPNGTMGYYDKRHLFAYAGEHEHFSAGNKRLIASVKGWRVCLLICYDLRFPVWARAQPKENPPGPEYDLLIYVANWPEKRSLAWKTLLQARAIENQAFVAGVNRVGKDGNDILYSGDSTLIDPLGEVIYQKAQEEDCFTYTLQKEYIEEVRTRFPFWKDGDHFIITDETAEEK
jgi:omega-amidase